MSLCVRSQVKESSLLASGWACKLRFMISRYGSMVSYVHVCRCICTHGIS